MFFFSLATGSSFWNPPTPKGWVEGEGFALTFYLPPASQGGEPGRFAARQKTGKKMEQQQQYIYKNKRKQKKRKWLKARRGRYSKAFFFKIDVAIFCPKCGNFLPHLGQFCLLQMRQFFATFVAFFLLRMLQIILLHTIIENKKGRMIKCPKPK